MEIKDRGIEIVTGDGEVKLNGREIENPVARFVVKVFAAALGLSIVTMTLVVTALTLLLVGIVLLLPVLLVGAVVILLL